VQQTEPPPVPRILPSARLLGVRVHRVTLDLAVDVIGEFIREGGAHQVVTLNGAMLARAAGDPALRGLIERASLVTPDGAGVLLAGWILEVVFPERIPGIDMIDRLCATGAASGLRIFLLGARAGVADEAAAAMGGRYPGVSVVGTHHGYFADQDDNAVTEQVRTSRPHVLLVAMGFPRQEQWIMSHLAALGVPVCIGVGGTLDVLAGRSSRAPRWMQRAGLEWMYRLLREPRRWRTAAALPVLIWLALRERLIGGKKEVTRES
jgi:N-acetylglucosaminyldiphosphoundecaprenol N-acetyl-beta-D-mannosaminyltransferase